MPVVSVQDFCFIPDTSTLCLLSVSVLLDFVNFIILSKNQVIIFSIFVFNFIGLLLSIISSLFVSIYLALIFYNLVVYVQVFDLRHSLFSSISCTNKNFPLTTALAVSQNL
jgi:hypothetical protein